MAFDEHTQEKIKQYLLRAHQAFDTAEMLLQHGDYTTVVNRTYYTIFYAANALLVTKGLERSKHSGVLAAFREHFVKTGIIEAEYSRDYGAAMDARHASDYQLPIPGYKIALRNLDYADRFLQRIEKLYAKWELYHDLNSSTLNSKGDGRHYRLYICSQKVVKR
jgi:uncharacterized protein (UPF0332 family)